MGASEASIAGRVAPKMSVFVNKNFFEVVTNSNQMSNVQALIGFTFYRVATLILATDGQKTLQRSLA